MIMARRVALNGVQLDEVDERIVISAVEPGEANENITSTESAAGYGSRITSGRRGMLDIIVRFRILENGRTEAGMAARAAVLEAVNAWARAGGIMTVNYKPNRRLNVTMEKPATEGSSLWDFSQEYTLAFRAYAIPYWEDENASTVTFGGSSASGSRYITLEGSAKTTCDAEIVNTSGMTINSMTVRVGGNTMTFRSLGLGGSEALVIDHVDGLVRIRIRNGSSYRSAMAARTGANDFMSPPGSQYCAYSADRAVRMTVSWRSRYL